MTPFEALFDNTSQVISPDPILNAGTYSDTSSTNFSEPTGHKVNTASSHVFLALLSKKSNEASL